MTGVVSLTFDQWKLVIHFFVHGYLIDQFVLKTLWTFTFSCSGVKCCISIQNLYILERCLNYCINFSGLITWPKKNTLKFKVNCVFTGLIYSFQYFIDMFETLPGCGGENEFVLFLTMTHRLFRAILFKQPVGGSGECDNI